MPEGRKTYTVKYKGKTHSFEGPVGLTHEQQYGILVRAGKIKPYQPPQPKPGEGSPTPKISDPVPTIDKKSTPEKLDEALRLVASQIVAWQLQNQKMNVALGEIGLMVGSGAITSTVGGLAAVGAGIGQAAYEALPGDQPGTIAGATKFAYDYFADMAYEPQSEKAMDIATTISDIVTLYEEKKHQWLGQPVLEFTGSPGAATLSYMAPEIVASVLGVRGLRKSVRKSQLKKEAAEKAAKEEAERVANTRRRLEEEAIAEARIRTSEEPLQTLAEEKVRANKPEARSLEYEMELTPEEVIASSPHLNKVISLDERSGKVRIDLGKLKKEDRVSLRENIATFKNENVDIAPIKVLRGDDGTLIPIGDPTVALAARLAGRNEMKVRVIEANRQGIENLLEIGKKGLKEGLAHDITIAALVAAKEGRLGGKYDTAKRVMDIIAEHMETSGLVPETFYKTMDHYNINPRTFGKLFAEVYSPNAKSLNLLSQWKREMSRLAKQDPKLKKFLEQAELLNQLNTDHGWVEGFLQQVHNTGQYLRASAVVQPITTFRNFITESANVLLYNYAINPLAHVFKATAELVKNNPKAAARELDSLYDITAGLKLAATPSGRKFFDHLFSSKKNAGAAYKNLLLKTPVHEIFAGRQITGVMNKLNELQTNFTRRAVFYAKLEEVARRNGLDLRSMNPSDIPESFYKEAYDHAMEMTFSRLPESPHARAIIRSFDSAGGWLLQMFPRFVLGNSLPWMIKHSPIGLVSKRMWSRIKAGDPRGYEDLAKAAIGTGLIKASEVILDNLEKEGYVMTSWNQMPIGERDEKGNAKFIDLRSFAPLSWPIIVAYAWRNVRKSLQKPGVAEQFVKLRDSKGLGRAVGFALEQADTGMTLGDFAEILFGMNRVSDSALGIVQVMNDQEGSTAAEKMAQIIGNYAGIATIPLKPLKDTYVAGLGQLATMTPDEGGLLGKAQQEALRRDAAERYFRAAQIPNTKYSNILTDLLAPAISNAPGSSGLLSPRALPGEGFIEPDPTQSLASPVFRYFEQSLMSQELRRLKIAPARVNISLGNKELNNVANLYNHEMAERALAELYQNTDWEEKPDYQKQQIIISIYQNLAKPFGRAKVAELRTGKVLKREFLNSINPEQRATLEHLGIFPEILFDEVSKDLR